MNAPAEGVKLPLDDVMMSMDVVDTIRQDQRIAEREINDETRRSQLIERLRAIYHGQGIEVPDHILEEGVRALEERRFAYEPPHPSLSVTLARLYVTRWRWSKWLGGGLLAVLLLWTSWEVFYAAPRTRQQAADKAELSQLLPENLNKLYSIIGAETNAASVEDKARQLRDAGLAAAASGKAGPARQALAEMKTLLDDLRLAYDIKIVSRPGEQSGLWRIPKVNPKARNYYLIVEAVDSSGRVLELPITNEETGRLEKVKKWAVRVSQSAFDAVQADKRDDGIIQRPIIGVKRRGELEPQWRLETLGGTLTQW
ncbi:MAG: DUF6384 family protein [Rhodomicrobiaceae bacterium]